MKKVSRPKIKREKKRADKIKKLIAVYTELYKSFSGKVSVTDLEVAGYSYDQVRYYFGNIKQLDKEAREAKPTVFLKADKKHKSNAEKENAKLKRSEMREKTEQGIIEVYSNIAELKGYTSMEDMVSAGYTKDAVYYYFGSLANLNREAREAHPEKFFDTPLDPIIESPHYIDKLNDIVKNNSKFLITTAITGCRVEEEFLESMKIYCKCNDAKLLVLVASDPAHNYFNPGAKYGTIDKSLIDDDISIVVSDVALNSNVHLSTVKLGAKHMDPATSMERIAANSNTFIFASPKQRLKPVAVSAEKLPHFVMTSGAITMSDYSSANYMSGRTAFIADNDHIMGAVIMEIQDDKIFHFRQVQRSPDSPSFADLGIRYNPTSYVKENPWGLIMGDWHSGSTDPIAKMVWEEVLSVTKPTNLVMHDTFDGFSINHHIENDMVVKAMRVKQGRSNLYNEIVGVAKDLDHMRGLIPGNLYVVKSNHDEVLIKYLKRGKFIKDHENAEYAADLFKVAVRKQDPLQFAVEEIDPHMDNVIWLQRKDSLKVAGVELAMHGDKGPKGAKGTINNLEKTVTNLVKGHSHEPEILRGAFQVGTSSLLQLEYNEGDPSAWMHTSCLIYEDGTKQLINSIYGDWRLK